MSLETDLILLKKLARDQKNQHKRIRDSLDDGDCAEYNILESCDSNDNQILRLLRKMGKEHLTNIELHAKIVTQQNESELSK